MNKKRVLVVSEAHYVSSGFGTYANEVLTRLHKTGKYELAEFASYGKLEQAKCPWLFYANLPNDNNKQEVDLYNSNSSYQFGTWRFDRVCLDFKPDIVISYRDPWMDNWIQNDALRKYFHWIWMPTVDSAPQKQNWIDTFSSCDALLAYSEFGGNVLQEQGKERVNFIGCASPGIDPNIYKPMPKASHRASLNVDPDCFIVGTVMRNQKRKLFFELMKAFRMFLDQAPPEIAAKTFLYLHTSYPERQGWDIAEGLMQNNLGGKIMMTYICKHCNKFFPAIFQDAITTCKYCHQKSAVCPTVSMGVSVPDLAQIYNLFDIYIQYAICEGFGMPQVEAAACGIPVAATDYSAMSDVIQFTKGYPIPVRTFFRELETNAERAYPDNEALAKILVQFFTNTDQDRLQKSLEVRTNTIQRYNWDKTAQVWEQYLDNYTVKNQQGQWDAPPQITSVPDSIPDNLSNDDFAIWICSQVLHDPDMLHRPEGVNLSRSLALGAEITDGHVQPINRDQIFEKYKQLANNNNMVEAARVDPSRLANDQFIVDAHERMKSIV